MQTLVCAVVLFINLAIQPWRSGVVASGTSPDGTACVVSQRWNGWDDFSEPYTVRLYARRTEGEWQCYYIDHEAMRWKSCKMTFSEDGSRLFIVGGDGKRRSFDLAQGQQPGNPPYLPLEMEDRR
ncbi:hypothetical protein [Luteolibacter sp. Populi]|uniref:hypothetical protein n=1 Tax=Luteolibacter sp. Populi TaxID=3230487 RepID=UPI0034658FE9